MPSRRPALLCVVCIWGLLAAVFLASEGRAAGTAAWNGGLRDASGKAVSGALIVLREVAAGTTYSAKTSVRGEFIFAELVPGSYDLKVTAGGKTWTVSMPVAIGGDFPRNSALELSLQDQGLRVV